MLLIVLCVVASLPVYTHEYWNVVDLPLAPAEINSNESAKKSCKLPPYPENGGYVVVEEPNARPGDVFDNISLVQYVNADEEHLVELKNFVCTAGRWSLKIYKYESEKMYFNTSWCRLFESSALIRQWTDPFVDRTQGGPNNIQQFASSAGTCTLPPYPAGGSYTVVNKPNAVPGNVFESAHLLYSCSKRRVLYGNKDVYCFNNAWSSKTPNCVKCGVSTAGTEIAVAKGRPANPKEITWQVAIYDKNFKPFKHICGGSVIASNLVISAAHCFWTDIDKLRPASRFAVAAGKIRRPWDDPNDDQAQKSDVSEIIIPPRFRGSQTNFQDDIALLFLTRPFVNTEYVVPLCVDFDVKFDKQQLTHGNLGKIAGWGLIDEIGTQTGNLQTAEFPTINIDQCINEAAPDFRVYITSDKICAGYTNGTALCKGDSGGGIAFSDGVGDEATHYLRGVISTAPTNNKACNVYAVTSFTHLLAHQHFIKENLDKAVWL